LGVDREILALLNGVTVSELWDCQLILVFCPIASRAGTNIEDALRKIPGNYSSQFTTRLMSIYPETCIMYKTVVL